MYQTAGEYVTGQILKEATLVRGADDLSSSHAITTEWTADDLSSSLAITTEWTSLFSMIPDAL